MFDKKIKLFRLVGFEVGIDPTWILLAVLVAWSLSTGYFPFYYRNLSNQAYWIMGIVGAAGLFLSIIFHEFCHSMVARRSGMPIKGITLFIFGGVAEMDEEPPSAGDEFRIAVAGPVSSLAMAAVFYGLERPAIWPLHVTAVLGYLATINLILALFNLVPAYPLDGGRILRSILWGWKGDLRWATDVSSRIGSGFGIFLIVFGLIRVFSGLLIGGMWLVLIGLFIRAAARGSYRQLLVRQALQGERVRRFMNPEPISVAPSVTVDELVENYIYRHHHKLYPVIAGDRLSGCVTTRQVKAVPRDRWSATTVGEIAAECGDGNTLSPDTEAVDALAAMRRNGSSRMMVVENGRLAGIISLKDLLAFLSIKLDFVDA